MCGIRRAYVCVCVCGYISAPPEYVVEIVVNILFRLLLLGSLSCWLLLMLLRIHLWMIIVVVMIAMHIVWIVVSRMHARMYARTTTAAAADAHHRIAACPH